MDEATPEVDIRHYLRILNRRRWIIVLTVLAAAGASLAVSTLSDRVYAAEAQILISDPSEGSIFNENLASGLVAGRDIQTQMQVMSSKPMRHDVEKKLGRRAPLMGRVSVSQIGTTSVVRIRVESTVPVVARDGANAFAAIYINRRVHDAIDTLVVASNELQKAGDAKKAEIENLDAQIAKLQAAKGDAGQIALLQQQRDDLQRQYSTYRDKYSELQVDASLRRGGAQLVAAASVPDIPVRPTPVRNVILALMLGLFVGVGIAFLFEFLDDSVKTIEDLERTAPNLAFLGAIPAVADWRNRDLARAVTIDAPRSPVAEAYRSVRTSVQFVALRQPLQTLLLTSPMSSEGKSTTIANLGVTMARSGRNVVIADCDLRRPRLHEFFAVPNEIGFTSVLLGDEPLSAALRTVDLGSGFTLNILPSGPLPPNPSELLGTNRVAELLTALQGTADIVLIDSPPLLPVTDALVLSRRVDGILLVSTAGVTSRRHLSRAVAQLEHAEAPVIGIVLNAVPTEGGSEYGYSYYRQDPPTSRRRRGTSRGTRAGGTPAGSAGSARI